MIPKTEGIHAWTPPGASKPAIELGRVRKDDGTPLWPRFKLKRVTGLSSLGEAEDIRDRPPGADREIPRRSERRGKTVVYEGVLECRDLYDLREAEALFDAAFDDLEGEGRIDAFWHPRLLVAKPAFAAVPPKFFEAKALTADIPDVQEGQGFDRPFVVGLRMSDRRYFDEESAAYKVSITETESLKVF